VFAKITIFCSRDFAKDIYSVYLIKIDCFFLAITKSFKSTVVALKENNTDWALPVTASGSWKVSRSFVCLLLSDSFLFQP